MTDGNTQENARADGHEQAEISTISSGAKAGEAWVKAIAASAISERAWTLSRIDSTLGSIT